VRTFAVRGRLASSTVIAGGGRELLPELLRDRLSAVVTDDNVRRLHGESFPDAPVLSVPPGEGSKTIASAGRLLKKFASLEIDRDGFILAVGGGMVTDLAGFCATVYMRGISFGFLPTTLLAQVDAAIGGKNGVNLEGYKNLVGTFSQPEFVLCDPYFLDTLPPPELRSGLSECIKAAAIADPVLFRLIEERARDLLAGRPEPLREVIERSVAVKAEVVSADERESGRRRLLNFGHTFGHAVERTLGLSHGDSVAAGMAVAGRLSRDRGWLSAADFDRLLSVLAELGLPTSLAADGARVLDALKRDKKRKGEGIEFVLLKGIGEAVTERIGFGELAEAAGDLR